LHESFVELVGEAKAGAAVEFYRQRFSSIGLYENELYPGIPQLLEELRNRRHLLFVASSKPRVFVERILQHFDLAKFFTAIYGSELDGRLQDKGELLAHALADQQLQGVDCVMIGDRQHDALGAANNGMGFIGVLYGFGSVEEFSAHGFNRWVELPGQLLDAVT
jgi:phosphoglycolate phosphatase